MLKLNQKVLNRISFNPAEICVKEWLCMCLRYAHNVELIAFTHMEKSWVSSGAEAKTEAETKPVVYYGTCSKALSS